MPKLKSKAGPLNEGGVKKVQAGRQSHRLKSTTTNIYVLDEGSRRLKRFAALEALECNNFADLNSNVDVTIESEDFYVDETEINRKSVRAKQSDKQLTTKSQKGVAVSTTIRSFYNVISHEVNSKAAVREEAIKSLGERVDSLPLGAVIKSGPNLNFSVPAFEGSTDGSLAYIRAGTKPALGPPRKICSVCGFSGNYSCERCGLRYCSIKCQEVHMEICRT